MLIWRSQEGASGALAKGPFGVGPMSASPLRIGTPYRYIQFRYQVSPGTGGLPGSTGGEELFSVVAAAHWPRIRMSRHWRPHATLVLWYFLQHTMHKDTIAPAARGVRSTERNSGEWRQARLVRICLRVGSRCPCLFTAWCLSISTDSCTAAYSIHTCIIGIPKPLVCAQLDGVSSTNGAVLSGSQPRDWPIPPQLHLS